QRAGVVFGDRRAQPRPARGAARLARRDPPARLGAAPRSLRGRVDLAGTQRARGAHFIVRPWLRDAAARAPARLVRAVEQSCAAGRREAARLAAEGPGALPPL